VGQIGVLCTAKAGNGTVDGWSDPAQLGAGARMMVDPALSGNFDFVAGGRGDHGMADPCSAK